MLRYAVRRLFWMIPAVIVVTFFTYIFVRVGWNPEETYQRANPRASQAKVDEYIAVNGLYEGFWGYIRGYFQWAWNFVRGPGHWPRSIKGRADVWKPLRHSVFNTLRLAGASSITGVGLGLTFGILAGRRPGKVVDSMVNGAAFIVGAVPPFVSGVVLQLYFAAELKWLPTGGVYPPGHEGFSLPTMLKHMVLPVAAVAIQTIAQYSRFMRASLLDVRSSDYVRTARSKGISENRILMRHSVRNALIPVVTLLGIEAGQLIGGLVITERIFNYPGMGRFFIIAATNGDIPQLMPYLTLIVVSVLFFNLIADMSYALLDPRIRLD